MAYPVLNFPPVRLRAARRRGCDYVWDDLRGAWLLLTPEEWVRRHLLGWLREGLGVAPTAIVQEYPVALGGTAQRADVVVLYGGQRPLLLAECKAAGVTIDARTLDQAVRYNSVVGARYLMLTNGLRHYFYETADGLIYEPLAAPPDLSGR